MRSKYKYKYKYNYAYKYFRIVVNMGSKYKAGVPELDLPALDPLIMPEIELNLGNSKVKFEDIVADGLSRFTVNSVKFDKASSSIKLSMVFDEMESTGEKCNMYFTPEIMKLDKAKLITLEIMKLDKAKFITLVMMDEQSKLASAF